MIQSAVAAQNTYISNKGGVYLSRTWLWENHAYMKKCKKKMQKINEIHSNVYDSFLYKYRVIFQFK